MPIILMKLRVNHDQISNFLDGHDSNHEEGSLQDHLQSDAEHQSGFHVFVSDDLVLFVVLLDFDCEIIKVISQLVEQNILRDFLHYIKELDCHTG